MGRRDDPVVEWPGQQQPTWVYALHAELMQERFRCQPPEQCAVLAMHGPHDPHSGGQAAEAVVSPRILARDLSARVLIRCMMRMRVPICQVGGFRQFR